MPDADPPTDDTPTLTAAMARGEPSAIDTFYRRHFDTMLAHAQQFTRRDEHFCLDVVQDATLKVVRSVRRMQDEKHLRRWLRRVVASTAIDRLRAEQRRALREQHGGVSGSDDPAEAAALAEQIAELDRRLARLDATGRRLLHWRFAQGLTLADIGRRLGLGPGAVDGRLRRTLTRLQRSEPR